MKKSFILYMDSLSVLELLSDDQAGKLLKAFREYHITGKVELDVTLRIAFSQFKNQFDRDAEKYERTVEQNREKGKKSAERRAKSKKRTAVNSGQQRLTAANSGQQAPTDSTDNDNDSDKDSGSDNGSDNGKGRKQKKGKKVSLPPPSSEEVSTATQNFLAAYNDFLQPITGTGEKFSVAGRAGLKQIRAYLAEQVRAAHPDWGEAEVEDGSLKAWQFILSRYEYWEPFHQKQLKLEQINSNLVNIIAACKKTRNNGRTNPEQLATDVIGILTAERR